MDARKKGAKPIPARWLGFGAIALIGLVAVCYLGVISNQDSDPRPYITDHYERAATLDEPDGGTAYTSPDARSTVTSDLRDNTDEYDHRSGDGIEFLQYDDHIVAVSDHGAGSTIYVDDYRTGYRRYSSHYGFFVLFGWSSSPPGAGGFRGGGGGFGK